ncbi:acetate--CoA ligase family protein [Phaeovibrio sulfidiphilus]|uniref:Acetate--CoA ligase family protein n=2 Tax=Phaeovibrio sulfidiphilus TaxID=1220600 RepID=A0A8J6YWX8_9PROT|nr:acetate--CoA ligase family protein [Phaeovibrio sulfidiphilus]
MTYQSPELTLFQAITAPRRVAFIGASDDPVRIGGRALAYCLANGFEGELLPVNARTSTVQGLPAVPSILDVDGEVDMAIVSVPAASVPDVIRDAGLKGVRAALIYAGGFAETGPEGQRLQDDLMAAARLSGIRIIGPNCLGLINCRNGFTATFSGAGREQPEAPGGLTIVSQSGSYGVHTYLAALAGGARPGMIFTTGNECDIDTSRVIRMAVDDPLTEVIGVYAEGIRNGAALISALDAARRAGKPVLFMKVGRSEVGASAAVSHTASLTGEDAVLEAILAQYGAVRVHSTEHMIDVAKAAIPRIYPAGRRLGIISISGGAGVLMADWAEDEGIEVPALPEARQAELSADNPMGSMRNPLDVTAHILNEPDIVYSAARGLFLDGTCDAAIAYWSTAGTTPAVLDKIVHNLEKGIADYPDKLVFQAGIPSDRLEELARLKGHPVFQDPTRAVRAMASMMRLGEAFRREDPAPFDCPEHRETLPEGPLSEHQAKAVLARAGIPMVEDILAPDAAAVARAAEHLGGPVALKIASPDILHKTDVGGVRLNVLPPDAGAAAEGIFETVARTCPEARIDGILVSPMVPDGVDCILGARRDPVFGMVVLVGIGGIFTEVLDDVAIRKAPVHRREAIEMLDSLRGRALLEGARGQAPVNREALVEAVVAFSRFAACAGPSLDSVEINPLRASASGVLGLDALIVSTAQCCGHGHGDGHGHGHGDGHGHASGHGCCHGDSHEGGHGDSHHGGHGCCHGAGHEGGHGDGHHGHHGGHHGGHGGASCGCTGE